jgi:hypothetical protein
LTGPGEAEVANAKLAMESTATRYSLIDIPIDGYFKGVEVSAGFEKMYENSFDVVIEHFTAAVEIK